AKKNKIILLTSKSENSTTINYPCSKCANEVLDNDSAVKCDYCHNWIHIHFAGLPDAVHNSTDTIIG
uniref:Uncharacterized protein n=1 Tax=Romanomermis culicivorax TaxID=13658 RepID=A0A915J716_ROMCU